MRRKIWLLVIFLILAASLLASGNINFWQKLFTEPVETIYIIMKDGAPFRYSNQHELSVHMKIEELESELKTPGQSYEIGDIAIIIHNHFKYSKFSPEDYRYYKRLKKHGFKGLFMIYCHRTNKTYCMEHK